MPVPHLQVQVTDDLANFTRKIQQECLEGSAIDPALYAVAVAIHSDLEIVGGEPSTPIHDALNWTYTRFGLQARAALQAALFLNEDGSCWQAKLSRPRQDGGKTVKYESPSGSGSKPYLPPLPPEIRKRIAARYGVNVPLEGSFWAWLAEHPEIPIIFTEGAKKALSLISQGYVAIALYGVNGGYRSTDTLKRPLPRPVLISELAQFTGRDRTVFLAFDQDEQAKTRRKVTAALFKFGGLLSTAGCSVKLALWDGKKGKGCDDLIAITGAEAFHSAIDQAQTLDEYRLWLALENRLTIAPALRVNTADLSTLEGTAIPQSGILAIASAKGTGKTKFIGSVTKSADSALLLGHRIALTRNLCARLGIDYRGSLDKVEGKFINGCGYTMRVGGCVDGTLLAVNPADFEGCDLVIDEAVQVLSHLLTSSTCNKEGKRPVLLSRFAELVCSARRVILADADLDNSSLQYIQSLRENPTERLWLLVNDAKVEPWPVTFIEAPDPSPAIARLLSDIRSGKRVFVATDSKAGSKRLEKLIAQIEGIGVKVLLLNSETSGGEIEKAFIQDPDSNLEGLQVAIATPSMGTGVSIEANYFDTVYGLFWGASSTDADMSQALARVRAAVPRVVWCAKSGFGFSRIGRETSPLRLKKLLIDKTNATAQLTAVSLGASLEADLRDQDWLNPHVDLWARVEAGRNRSMLSLRTALKVRLIHEGHSLTLERLETDDGVKETLRAVREQIKEAEADAIASAANITAAEARALEQLESLEPDERLALAKFHLAEFYALPLEQVTAALALADSNGRRRGQLLSLEQFIYPDAATEADTRALEKQTQWGKGICPWDSPHATLKRQVREYLGLREFVEGDTLTWTADSLEEFKIKALELAPQVKAALNVSIDAEMSATQILGQLLEQMGLSTESQQVRLEGGKRGRVYWLDAHVRADAMTVLARRAQRRETLVTPPSVIDSSQRGCDRQEPQVKGAFPTSPLVAEIREMVAEAGGDTNALAELGQLFPPDIGDISGDASTALAVGAAAS